MSLHPIRVLDRVIEEYRDYLTTEFRAKDQGLKQALERELERPRFLAQEAFYQARVGDAMPIDEAARRCRLLWDLNGWLTRAPTSAGEIAARVAAQVPERAGLPMTALRTEIEAVLTVGAALPDSVPGALRLRAHRLIRGGWRFYRCVDPACGRLYPMGEERCNCGRSTAPLFLCRNCGADYLRFVGDVEQGPLRPGGAGADGEEWMLYDPARLDALVDEPPEGDDDNGQAPPPPRLRGRAPVVTQMRDRPVLSGSFDPATLAFSRSADDYPLRATLAPARTRCLYGRGPRPRPSQA